MMQKTWKMTQTLAYGYSSDTLRELSNEYQHDRVQMLLRTFCIFFSWTKLASVWKGLMNSWTGIVELTEKLYMARHQLKKDIILNKWQRLFTHSSKKNSMSLTNLNIREMWYFEKHLWKFNINPPNNASKYLLNFCLFIKIIFSPVSHLGVSGKECFKNVSTDLRPWSIYWLFHVLNYLKYTQISHCRIGHNRKIEIHTVSYRDISSLFQIFDEENLKSKVHHKIDWTAVNVITFI